MVIKINYTSSDVYVSTSVSPVYVVVNYSGTSGGGGGVWGQITGTLSDQTDLQDALDDLVPYSGATGDVNLGTHRILAQNATIASSGSGDTVTLNHTSGSGIGLNITKGGNGEGLYVNKTSGSGNAATIIGTLNATTLVKSGGTSSQFLKADGSVDSTTYVGGSGATGQVAYWNGTNSQTGDNNLFWNSASIRLGIGRTPSARRLEIQVGNGSIASALGLFDGGGSLSSIIGIETVSTNDLQIANVQGIRFYTGSTLGSVVTMPTNERMRLFNTGNLLLQNGGTFTDNGQRLQVQGDAFIKGSGNTSATTALTVQNSGGTNVFRVRNDRAVIVNAATTLTGLNAFAGDNALLVTNGNSAEIFKIWNDGRCFITGVGAAAASLQIGNTVISHTGNTATYTGAITQNFDITTQFDGFSTNFRNTIPVTATGGTANHVNITATVSATGVNSVTYTSLRLNPTINQSGGATQLSRGLYVNPTLTAAADWRSIEWSNNSGWGLYGAGTAANFLAGTLTAASFIRTGGTSAQILAADGSVITAGTNITISGGTISASGGGGGSDIYTADGTLTANRSLTHGGFNLSFIGGTHTNRFTSAGRLLLGTTTEGIFLLDINANARINTAQIGRGNGTNNTNVAFGENAMYLATVTGGQNVAIGRISSRLLTSGEYNTTVGHQTAANLTTGVRNAIFGSDSGNVTTGNGNTVVGAFSGGAITTGSGNIFIGNNAGGSLTGSNILSINSKFLSPVLEPTNAIIYGVQSATLSNQILRLNARTGIGLSADPVASAQFQIDSSDKGFLPPRMTNAQRTAISSPAVGLIVYCTDAVEGLYVYKSMGWTFVI